ncbi:mannose-6-phosphate isomerase [Actinoplanes sp. SE50]|uniref:mannose-6-phosphate isomerase, class I n=1 Tax=unclassified Actinoplanes TaxID=2626549 RepID=UPI00023ECA1A|nr:MULTISPECIES: mannose-6-phosphate isomerase, class I [unclassified Actinoplanes]AEV87105.1 mannose-6-phosphate isomerase [Actinoplanes sp. SE50/110]ATO85503.1 mannose-6-phosphate isomerase [Actinoplanes sp. SE50]SLM02915.1 mannose-6-phosphate isomerase, class I [Actinoplanes sp. SE50/110]
MDLLKPVVKPYEWGSRYAVAELQGRSTPSLGPEAELWMGAHPGGPSGLDRDGAVTDLEKVVAADPEGEIGESAVKQFGPRLPFLLKVIAAEKALSIQVHPDRQQAEAGFREENERILAGATSTRTYVDDWPKPEIVYSLTPFQALAGFRSAPDAAALLDELGVPQLAPIAETLRQSPAGDARSDALVRILTWPTEERAALLDAVVAAFGRVAAGGGRYAPACAAMAQVAVDHPGDLGLVAGLLLEYVELPPGAALYMPAGGVHAYLKGVGVEVLANSDNVLRAGLTGKHIDVAELARIAQPSVPIPQVQATTVSPGVTAYDVPAPEFRLYVIEPRGGRSEPSAIGPRILLCLEGRAVVRVAAGDSVELHRGESCFVAARDGAVTVTGDARVVMASVG